MYSNIFIFVGLGVSKRKTSRKKSLVLLFSKITKWGFLLLSILLPGRTIGNLPPLVITSMNCLLVHFRLENIFGHCDVTVFIIAVDVFDIWFFVYCLFIVLYTLFCRSQKDFFPFLFRFRVFIFLQHAEY